MSIFTAKHHQAGFPVEGDGSHNEQFRAISLEKLPRTASGSVTIINSDASVADALKTLGDAKILAAPVRDNEKPDSANVSEKYMGVIDFNTIVHWLMQKTWGHAPASLEELRQLKATFSTTKVSDLFLEGGRTPFVPITEDNTFLDVLIFLGKYGIHRVWTVGSSDITNVVTQSAVVEILAQNIASFPDLASKNIHGLGLGANSNVAAVSIHDTYWEAFRTMHEKHISAVPVLGDAGEIVGNISARDLRQMILNPAQFHTLAKPIAEFFTKGLSVHTVKPSDSLESVLRQFQSTRVHRLYVVDANGKPTGVVSLRDVIAQFVREPASEDGVSPYLAFFQ